ncbi:hypothetical protein [Lactococcus lactis]|uniref:hypothetical protein n=1 Tax=Lactococcus lactis TaxID=1358 RepID=UPI0038D0B8AC
MNPRISELFEEIDVLEKDRKMYQKWMDEESDFMPFLTYIKVRGKIQLAERTISLIKIRIEQISSSLNPQIPEPWASMNADEIIKGLGVYR